MTLANWLESRKMASALTGPLLGGPLLADIISRMGVAAAAYGVGGTAYAAAYDNSTSLTSALPRLLLVSAHYNVLMGLLAALRLDALLAPADAAAVTWLTAMPAAAAVLTFELHADAASGVLAVRAVAQDGPATNYTIVPLPCTSAAGAAVAGAGACVMADFVSLATPALGVAGTPAAWCAACGNIDALPCVAVLARSNLDNGRREGRRVALGVGLGIGLSLPAVALSIAACVMCARRRNWDGGGGRGVMLGSRGATVLQHGRLQEQT